MQWRTAVRMKSAVRVRLNRVRRARLLAIHVQLDRSCQPSIKSTNVDRKPPAGAAHHAVNALLPPETIRFRPSEMPELVAVEHERDTHLHSLNPNVRTALKIMSLR